MLQKMCELWKSLRVELGSKMRTKPGWLQKISPVCLTCQHVFWLLKKGLNWNHISVPSSRSQTGWVEFTDTYTHLNKQNRSLPGSLLTFLAVSPRPSLLCLALPLQVTFQEGNRQTLLILSYVSIAFSRTKFCWFKHHDSHYARIALH